MRWILDTSILIPFRDGDALISQALVGLGGEKMTSIICQVELEGGVYREAGSQGIRRVLLDMMLLGIKVLDFGDAEARAYGQIVAQAGYSRRKLIDRMIAAQALIADATLVTLNPDNFTDISNLRVHSL